MTTYPSPSASFRSFLRMLNWRRDPVVEMQFESKIDLIEAGWSSRRASLTPKITT